MYSCTFQTVAVTICVMDFESPMWSDNDTLHIPVWFICLSCNCWWFSRSEHTQTHKPVPINERLLGAFHLCQEPVRSPRGSDIPLTVKPVSNMRDWAELLSGTWSQYTGISLWFLSSVVSCSYHFFKNTKSIVEDNLGFFMMPFPAGFRFYKCYNFHADVYQLFVSAVFYFFNVLFIINNWS